MVGQDFFVLNENTVKKCLGMVEVLAERKDDYIRSGDELVICSAAANHETWPRDEYERIVLPTRAFPVSALQSWVPGVGRWH